MVRKITKNFHKIRLGLATAIMFVGFLGGSLVFVQPVAHAAGCPGTQAPSGADCSKIPVGCPGGNNPNHVTLDPKSTLTCPYKPSGSFTCPVKTCTYKTPDSSNLCPDGSQPPDGDVRKCAITCYATNSDGSVQKKNGKPVIKPCKDLTDTAASSGSCTSKSGDPDLSKCDLFTKFINPAVNFAAGLVGVAVAIGIIVGGIQYSSSAGDPQKAAAAKGHIQNALIALVIFFVLYALLSWLIPGGLLNSLQGH